MNRHSGVDAFMQHVSEQPFHTRFCANDNASSVATSPQQPHEVSSVVVDSFFGSVFSDIPVYLHGKAPVFRDMSTVPWWFPNANAVVGAKTSVSSMEEDTVDSSGSECINRDTAATIHPRVAAVLQRERIDSRDPKWQERRQEMLTGTNAAILVVDSKQRPSWMKSKHTLYKIKTRQLIEPRVSCAATSHGIQNENNAAILFEQMTGIELIRDDIGLLVHKLHSWIGATPDRLCRYIPALVEIKCPYTSHIRHAVPVYYMPQVQLQLEICELDVAFFVQFKPSSMIFEGQLDIVIVKRDPEWFAASFPVFRQFWNEVENFKNMAIQEPSLRDFVASSSSLPQRNDNIVTRSRPSRATKERPSAEFSFV